jgi:hypothetical protein
VSAKLEHDPDCERTGDSCLVCKACAEEVSKLSEWPEPLAEITRLTEGWDDDD